MKRIDVNARTIRTLLDGAKFSIDSYQLEYAWKERQIQELIDDLTGKFLGCCALRPRMTACPVVAGPTRAPACGLWHPRRRHCRQSGRHLQS